jgi:dTDP-4-amino-4,6-dideoxygalactose transaminase
LIVVAVVSPSIKVPLLDLRAQHAALREELRAAIDRVLDSQQYVLGAEVEQLETEVARYCETRFAIGCASGSDALLLVLMALGVRAGDEVITTPFTFFATVSAVTRLGAHARLVDIDPQTFNIDPDKIENLINNRTRAIMPVHLYGQCAEMDKINEIAARHNFIPVIEDAAQAIGAEDNRRRASSMSLAGCLSFYPTKNLGATGDAGMIVTDDEELTARLRTLRVHGETARYFHKYVGINSRLDALQAAVLRVKLPYLDRWSAARARNAARYDEMFVEAGLTDTITLPFVRPNVRHIFNQYVVRAPRRDELIEHLKEHGIGAGIYYPLPLHLQECFSFLGYKAGDFPEAERAAHEVLALPIYPELTEEQLRYVVTAIRSFYH